MSRLIVKDLPENIKEQTLQDLFGQRGTVTDIQLKYTKDGKFRKFAFVGYQNENEAEEARKFLDKTVIKTSRIRVEKFSLVGDEKKPKSWSKHSADSTALKKKKKIEQESDSKIPKEDKKSRLEIDESAQLLEKYKDDPLFEEFLEVHAPGEIEKLNKLEQKDTVKEGKAVENPDGNNNKDNEDEDDDNDNDTETDKLANEQISDIEYMKKLMKGDTERTPRQKMEKKIKEKIKLFTVKLRDLPYNTTKKDIKDFFKPIKCYSIRLPRGIKGIAYAGFKTEKLLEQALIKDRSFIKGQRITVLKYTDTKAQEPETLNPLKNKWNSQEENLKDVEDISESGSIFFRNLAYSTTQEEIEQLFSKYGPLTEVNLPIDPNTKLIKGFGTVTFLMPEHAVKAFSELDWTILHGRSFHLLPAKIKDATEVDLLEESSNYKKKKSAKEKAQAGSAHNWNSLFLSHDAVAEVIADTYGTTKESVIGPDGKGSAAVRLALGETQIVAQTRKYLEERGVILDALIERGADGSANRSKTVILVKNLPAKTEPKVIREMFEQHGEVGRVILLPSGITAIVEFLEQSEAKKAFTRLAYSKYENTRLYLEWAPEHALKEPSQVMSKEKVETSAGEEEKSSRQSQETTTNAVEDDEEEPEPETTLFVKNLNFKTTDESLKKHFEGCGKIHYASVALKKDKNDPSNRLSMGYGFVRFMLKAHADKALKTLQQSVLDGKSLELKRSDRTMKNDVHATRKSSKKTKQTGTKILVRNVPFQAKVTEIRELFSTFGEIKALRLPKKMGTGSDSHRGFGFVDFSSESEAKVAFEALSQSTHLYGRRLVLEWAEAEEDVDQLRKRTADHFTSNDEVKKSRKGVFSLD